jgi:hypothetical protein
MGVVSKSIFSIDLLGKGAALSEQLLWIRIRSESERLSWTGKPFCLKKEYGLEIFLHKSGQNSRS